MAQVVRLVCARRPRATVGITTAIHGAGGFGKTTVARMVRGDRRVGRRFRGRVYWVTLGRDVRRGALVERVNDLVRRIDPARAQPFTDPVLAAQHLEAVLADGPRRLVILDDVWFEEQLAAFPVGGDCVRLVTTRVRSLVDGDVARVPVDQMTDAQARAVLTAGLPDRLPRAVVDGLLLETGRWPLLLRLVNKVMVAEGRSRGDAAAVAADVLGRLRRDGALHVDEVSGAAARRLDVDDPGQREKAVAATIEASAGLLSGDERARLGELAVFAEDEVVPVGLVAALWRATGGLSEARARALCAGLADLALLGLIPTAGGGAVSLHDVVRDYLRRDLGPARLARLHGALLDAVPEAGWADDRYLREHAVEHLLGAERAAGAEALATDLRWAGARLVEAGPSAPFADLGLVRTPRAERLAGLIARAAHLLAPTDPPHSVLDILHSRVDHDPDWGPQARALARARPGLVNAAALPDLPSTALRRVLTGHKGWVRAVAIAPDGTWLATGGDDGTVRLWDAATGNPRAVLAGHADGVLALAIAPDGSALVVAGGDGTVRVWDAATRTTRTELRCAAGRWRVAVVAPDASWAAYADGGTVRIWDIATGALRAQVSGNAGPLAVAPDASWVATSDDDGTICIREAATGARRVELTGLTKAVRALAIAPDGTWLASASVDWTVRIWDAATGVQRAELGMLPVDALAIAPDGTWLAAGDEDWHWGTPDIDGSVRIWDVGTGVQRAVLHTGAASRLAIAPDGGWLAAVREDTVSLWDTAAEPVEPRDWVGALAVAPDGSWVACAEADGVLRIRDAATGTVRTEAEAEDHHDGVHAVAIAPDGTWLVSGDDSSVHVRDVRTGRARATLPADVVEGLAFAPDGSWMIAAGEGPARIWDTATLTLLREIPDAPVCAVAVAPDGSWLAFAGSDNGVRVRDAATGALRAELSGHTDWVRAVAVAPDGTWLASGGTDRTVRVWDAVTGVERATLTGHTDAVRGVAISGDGAWIASVSTDRTVRVWSGADHDCVAVMRVERALTCCAWDAAGHLVVGGAAGMYRFRLNG